MKSHSLLAVMAVCVAALAAGCASTGVSRASNIATKMQNTEVALQEAKNQVDATLKAMEDVNAQAEADPTTAFKAFGDAVDELASDAGKIADKSASMNARLDAHFFSWQQEIQAISSPDVRSVSESRRQSALKDYQSLSKDLKAGQAKLNAAVTALQDLKIAMSTDLNAAGIKALAKLMSNATTDARRVQDDLGDLIEDVGKLRESMSVNKPQPAMDAAGQ